MVTSPEIAKLSLLFVAGVISGFINVMAGGGSSLTLPVLIFLGLDSALANGTNRIAVLLQNVSAIIAFRQERLHQFSLSLKLSLFTLPGAIIGVIIAVNINDLLFQRILGFVIIGIMITILFPRLTKKNTANNAAASNPWLVYLAMFGIGIYGGFLQVGVGFLLMAVLFHLLGFDLLHVNMHKVFIVFIFTLPTIIIFILTNNINWSYGLILSLGNATGAWWSAKISVKKGEKIIRIVLLIAMLIMALKLLKVL